MTTFNHPNLAVQRAGLPISGPVGPTPEAIERARRAQEFTRSDYGSSPLASQLPTFATEMVYFNQITVPDGMAATAGQSAVYGLRRVRVPADTGEEIGFLGADFHLLPADSSGVATPVGGMAALAWGDTSGLSAAIIIGRNLDMVEGQWKSATVYLPGLEQAAHCFTSRAGQPRYLVTRWFPAGKWNDTAPNKYQQFVPVAGYVDRITRDETLDVALVVRGSQIVNASGQPKAIVGLAAMNLTWLKLETSAQLSQLPPTV